MLCQRVESELGMLGLLRILLMFPTHDSQQGLKQEPRTSSTSRIEATGRKSSRERGSYTVRTLFIPNLGSHL